ncbi:MAG: sigma-70 family RNA polymerase sigma factor, partial [Planctomycetota bacterium]
SFVRTLSRRLVMDEHYAEDVAQETLLAAIERPPRSTGALRTWLAQVARNFVHSSWRNDQRRILRECKAFKKDVAPTPGEIVEHETVRRSVVKALLKLDKIYCDPILLKYYDDLAPREIARKLSLPVETVRTRVRRGLALMRNALDNDYGGDGRSWCLALMPVAGLKTALLPTGISFSLTSGAGKLLILIMSKPVAAAATLIVGFTMLFGFALFRHAEPGTAPFTPDPQSLVAARAEQAVSIINEPAGEEDHKALSEAATPPNPPTHPISSSEMDKSSEPGSYVPLKRSTRKPKDDRPQEQPGMALVPAGETWLGMDVDEAEKLCEGQKAYLDSLARSVPRHKVFVDAFHCDLYEVTQAQWALYLEKTNQRPSDDLMQFTWKNNTSYPEDEALFPVRNVSLKEARAFARWCGKRIPTENEWMRAAAGDDGRIYAWGNNWEHGKNCTNRRNTLSQVGSYDNGKSPFGIYDMTGSVWEWTNDKFEAYKGYKPPKVTIGGKRFNGEPGFNAQVYIIKGGHYLAGELANRLAIREPLSLSSNQDSVGFRCVKDTKPGMSALSYALDTLEGSCISGFKCNNEKMYSIEITELTDSEPVLISGFSYFLINPADKVNTTAAKIEKESPETPQPIGILSTNLALEEPNLPPGSYVLAYRHAGLSSEDKRNKQSKDAAKRQAEEEKQRKLEEQRQKELEKKKEERGIKETAKTIEEIEREKREKKLEEQLKK